MTVLNIIGAGGHARVVAEVARLSHYTDIKFWDDRAGDGAPDTPPNLSGTLAQAPKYPTFIAIGNNATRSRIYERLQLYDSPVLCHPAAVISQTANIALGSVFLAGAIINTDVEIGIGCIMNTACSIDHDCEIGRFVHISPGARLAGGVRVGDYSWIGIGAIVREGITIGRGAQIAAGAVVVKNVPDNVRVAGVPARIF